MKSNFWINRGVIFLAFSILSLNVLAQGHYRISESESSIKVLGTSTLHDWHMSVEKMDCAVDAVFDEKQNLIVSSIIFLCPVKSIKSENSMMDGKAYDALNAEKYKDIKFKSGVKTELLVNGGTLKGQLNGEMSIAGSNRKVSVPFEGEIDNNVVKLTGEVKMKMSDFNIKSPTAMMGTIKTGDEIVIQYKLVFK